MKRSMSCTVDCALYRHLPYLYKAARTCEMKLRQNTETTVKLFQSCFRLISIFTDMSKNMQIVKLFQAFQTIRAKQLLGLCSGAGRRCMQWSVACLACVLNHCCTFCGLVSVIIL